MPIPASMVDTPPGREIGGLALSVARSDNPMQLVRSAHWRNVLNRVGLPVPFFAVHDLGTLATDEGDLWLARRPAAASLPRAASEHLDDWLSTLREIGSSEVIEKARSWRLRDELITVLLLKVLGPVYERHRGPGRRPAGAVLPLDPEFYRDLDPQLTQLFTPIDHTADLAFLHHLRRERLRLVTSVEQIDLDTLRLLGLFGAEASAASALSVLDLLNVMSNPDASDIVDFSLDLLPSVLETKRASGQQVFGVDGYAGLARRGSLDSLVLSELAFDPELFEQRFAEHEVFYYAREKQHEEERRLHYLVVDASASMRGQRAIFARGLALTLIKKLSLQGEDVYFRFFDARLYDTHHARRRASRTGINIPYVLSFRGERGRNYAKVFGLLAGDLARLAKRERRTPILYLITHAECHVPLDTIERLRGIARLYGIFMLPSSGELDLEYLPRLHTVQVVDETALTRRETRAQRAMDIIDDATEERRPRTKGGASPW